MAELNTNAPLSIKERGATFIPPISDTYTPCAATNYKRGEFRVETILHSAFIIGYKGKVVNMELFITQGLLGGASFSEKEGAGAVTPQPAK